jgi:ribosomal-protein-serine acetyltransferase
VDGIQQKLGCCNLGYWVRTSRTGQGIASRAVRLMAKFAFQNLGLTRAEILIAAGNLGSQRAAQKAGAHFEGTLKKPLIVRAEVHDAVLYSFNPQDFTVEF